MSCRDRVIATVLALLALALGAAALFSEMAAAAWPGRSGPIVYLGVRPETSNTACCSPYKTIGLRVFEPGVPGSVRVLTVDRSDADPQISPDGRTIVFTREISSGLPFPLETERVIFAIGLDGSGLRQVTAVGTEAGSDFKPSFFPAGRRSSSLAGAALPARTTSTRSASTAAGCGRSPQGLPWRKRRRSRRTVARSLSPVDRRGATNGSKTSARCGRTAATAACSAAA